MKENLEVLPLIPLRGIIIFPYMILHFDVGREKSILALEEAMENGQKYFYLLKKRLKQKNQL